MDYVGRFFLVFDELKRKGLIKNYVELSNVLQTDKAGVSDLKYGRKKLSIEHVYSMKKTYPLIDTNFIVFGDSKMFLDENSSKGSAPIKELISEITRLSAQNERLRIKGEENRLLKAEIERLKNEGKTPVVYAVPEPQLMKVADNKSKYNKSNK